MFSAPVRFGTHRSFPGPGLRERLDAALVARVTITVDAAMAGAGHWAALPVIPARQPRS
ncbi:hypothetical protein ACGFJT_41480 [Actinomadura geliboluensis]|uniref:hypothetical protein n=1 Tax=Actinomadura geliboluensis TaxID=882440 RepID=UPI003720F177